MGQPGAVVLAFAGAGVAGAAAGVAGAAAGVAVTGLSGVAPLDPPESLVVAEVEVEAPSVDGGVPVPASAAAVAALDLFEACTLSRWSFLAHPEPLNTIAGVDSALRMAPPHWVHTVGPSAVNECITSMGCAHTVHTYS